MLDKPDFYIDGRWQAPAGPKSIDVINPATETPCGRISLGGQEDVDLAVGAALRAFETWSRSTREERLALLHEIEAQYKKRYNDIADAMTMEMGAPTTLSMKAQAGSGLMHLKTTIRILKSFEFEQQNRTTLIVREPIGVCALITPWNWPINQIAVKVFPALAAGCSMVLKPSEIAPFNAMLLAEVLHDAGVPPGVFNLVNGDGAGVGSALSSHPDVAMVSFTGSTRAGTRVAENAAATIKRVAQELGGKSANILLDDADFEASVTRGALDCFENTGQSCDAPTRMLVPAGRMDEAASIAAKAATGVRVGDPTDEETEVGPLASEQQWTKVQSLLQAGIDEGARLVAGGPGRPESLPTGFYAQPTVFADVRNDMRIAREEIFGPVLSIIGYENDEEAVKIANDTDYGLSGYVSSASLERARDVASRLRTGGVHINGAGLDPMAPFGGYKHSGNGREWGSHGFEEFLELKSIYGYEAKT